MKDTDPTLGWIFIVISLALYLLPSLIAWARVHHNFGAIVALNLFLGWTIIGWVASLIWSFTNPPPRS